MYAIKDKYEGRLISNKSKFIFPKTHNNNSFRDANKSDAV